ncbi:cytochrome c1, partial [Campylobacter jejuni]|nr:cytochrome c1 [Campylobacter jejuni]
QAKVVSYIDQVGDSKKEERKTTGIYVMIFFVILSIFAIGWKRSVWSKLH